jgi:acyl-CoA reductase-like NAD-dependent aldehyde dehydrogenase
MTQAIAIQQGSAAIPEAEHKVPSTSRADMDKALEALVAQKEGWLGLPIGERIRILESILRTSEAVAERWVRAALEAKRIAPGTAAEAEEWLAGPVVVVRNIRLLIRTLEDIAQKGAPELPGKAWVRRDGQVVAPVFPVDAWDALLFTGFKGEIWMDPDVRLEDLPDTQAAFYRDPPSEGKVALVLGAGNVSSIGPMDALYKLFAEGQVVLLKMNPVNEYLGPYVLEAFDELVKRGFFQVVYGGAAEGDYLCQHPNVDEIHITGSDKTHDAIVYGVGEEGQRRKSAREPRNEKRITSELGNVSPIIVVPGPWSAKDLDYQGANLVSSLTNNAGFNCNATRVVVQHAGWSQRNDLLESVKRSLRKAPPRAPYYPGAKERQQRFLDTHPDAFVAGPNGPKEVGWTMVTGLDPQKKDELCFTTEAWCGVTSEVALEAKDTVAYIEEAVRFCNDTCWGTLNAAIIVHPKSLQDPAVAAAVEKAIADLRFGSVVVNHWPALSYAFVSTTWGAFPGHELHDIRSGAGVVHNTFLFDRPQKSVIRGPFKVFPRPAWFFDNKMSHRIGPRMVRFNANPTAAQVPGLLFDALRG